MRRVLLLLVCASTGLGCDASTVPLAARLAAREPELAARLEPRPESWKPDGVGLTSPGWRHASEGPFVELGARLPARADGAIEIGIGQSERSRLRLVAVGATASPVADLQGRAVYRDTFPSTDLLFVADRQRLEEFLLLRDEAAPRRFRWNLRLPDGLSGTRRERDGGLSFVDAGGTARFHVPPPFAVDALGVRRAATLSSDGSGLTVELDARGLRWPVLLDPVFEVAVWLQRILSDRYGAAAAYDSNRKLTVLFGGTHILNNVGFGDTWSWDGTTWRALSSTGPPARQSHGLTYDALRDRMVLFGGLDQNNNALGDTWEWDGTTWSLRATSGPSARSHFCLAFSAESNRTLLFGGQGGSGGSVQSDTWQWDGTSWTQATVGASPSPRADCAMSFDSADKRVLLFGGTDSTQSDLQDTWAWSGSAWSLQASTGPSARGGASLASDGSGNSILFGGISHYPSLRVLNDTFLWKGAAWVLASSAFGPPAGDGHALAWDGGRNRFVLIGGNRAGTQTWEWNGSAWTQIPEASPGPRDGALMTYDRVRHSTVLFGGGVDALGNPLVDTWEWDGAAWKQTNTMGPASSAAMSYDAARAETLLFDTAGSTWGYKGAQWQKLTAPGPPTRSSSAMAFDDARALMVLFGGRDANLGINSRDTWEWNGSSWTNSPATGPLQRHSHALAYDLARQRTVLFGGVPNVVPAGVTSDLGDTWEYDGSSWSQVANTGPAPRYAHTLAYDARTRLVVLFGGSDSNGNLFGDTRGWDGTTWSLLANSGPAARRDHAMTYDFARSRIVLFGGAGTDETWELQLDGGACTTAVGCDSGFCVDGVCCEQSVCGVCQACNLPGSLGRCAPVLGADDDTCNGTLTCNAAGACLSRNGALCADGTACGSGICADGVCCASTCDQTCQTCTLIIPGVCLPTPANKACRKSGFACDGMSTSCRTSCASDADCAILFYCVAGGCVDRRPKGKPCTDTSQCQTMLACVDGVCCNSACAGPCVVCNLGGHEGTCTPAPAGTDPRMACTGVGPCAGSCGAGGACVFPGAEQRCDTCKACGGGRCDQLPLSGDDEACGAIACDGLSSECRKYTELDTRRCASIGLCATPNDPITCSAFVDYPAGTPCSLGACTAGQCGAVTVVDGGSTAPRASGCSAAGARPSPGVWFLLACLALLFRRRLTDLQRRFFAIFALTYWAA